MAASPLKADPTRTTSLRNRFARDMKGRLARLSASIRKLVLEEDAFGLKRSKDPFANNSLVGNRWEFETDDRKVEQYNAWLKEQVDQGFLEVDNNNEPWTSEYVNSSYRKGVTRAYEDSNPEVLAENPDFYQGTRAEFLNEAFNQPVAQQRMKMLGTRSFEQLKGVSAQMSANMSRVLTGALADGLGASEVARQLTGQVQIAKPRAERIARTELIHAYSEGQLDSFERLGVEEVGVMAEWLTAGDSKVCPRCSALEGVVMKVSEARGLIPRHPGCRCAWLPSGIGESSRGQKRSKSTIDEAMKKSLKAERPKGTLKDARDRSTWIGADKTIAKKRTTKKAKEIAEFTKKEVPTRPVHWDEFKWEKSKDVAEGLEIPFDDDFVQLYDNPEWERTANNVLRETRQGVLRDKPWKKEGVTAREYVSGMNYQSEGYRNVNSVMRTGKIDSNPVPAAGQSVDEVRTARVKSVKIQAADVERLAKKGEGSKITTYRGIVDDGSNEVAVIKSLKEGDEFIDDALISTSKDRQVADDFTRGDAQDVIFVVDSKGGLDMNKLYGDVTGTEFEEEIILAPKTRFRVNKVIDGSVGKPKEIYISVVK